MAAVSTLTAERRHALHHWRWAVPAASLPEAVPAAAATPTGGGGFGGVGGGGGGGIGGMTYGDLATQLIGGSGGGGGAERGAGGGRGGH